MVKAALWGFDFPGTIGAMKILQENNVLDIVVWIGDTRDCKFCTHNIFDYFKRRPPQRSYFGIAKNIREKLQSHLYIFMDMQTRHCFQRDDRTVYDQVCAFNILVDEFADLLITNKVEIVLFTNMPHEGADYLLYQVAKQLEIKTVILYQALFPDKCFYLQDIEDFGKFLSIPEVFAVPSESIHVEKKFRKELFYMQNDLSAMSGPSFLDKCLWAFGRAWKSINSGRIEHSLYAIAKKYEVCFRGRLYNRTINGVCDPSPDLALNYVYFPLHLQPELTTAALGGIYADQCLAIEQLSTFLPEGWYVYVKENPRQSYCMRSECFFDRLVRIQNVKIIHSSVDTYVLTEHCQFVSTIAGTAGWEAISGGKNVLVFGRAWYNMLPGVFLWEDQPSLQAILDYTIEHRDLEIKLQQLLNRCGNGVVDEAYCVIVNAYSHEANANKLASLLTALIGAVMKKN